MVANTGANQPAGQNRNVVRISHQHRFIYFSNPKCGSNTVRAILDPFAEMTEHSARPLYTHIRPVELRNVCRESSWEFFDEYFKFTTTRNPWDRLVSLYEMIKRREIKRRGGWRRWVPRARIPSFPEWVRSVRADGSGGGGRTGRGRMWRVYGTYSVAAFAGDGTGRELVDRVIRLEDLDTELPKVLRELGVPSPRTIQRQGPRRANADYRSYYDSETEQIVARMYHEDIMRFGYRFAASP